jgi:hypothetical protein
MKNDLYIVNKEHPNFVRLYWSTDKEKIKHILSRVNIKYLRGLIRKLIISDYDWCDYVSSLTNICIFLRYDGCQFLVNRKTIIKELYRRGL